MKRSAFLLLALLLPASIFAQGLGPGRGRMGGGNGTLKSFGLTDDQIAQVLSIEKSTRDTVRADLTHIRLVQAQIAEALLPATPDANAINALIDKKGQYRVDIEKSLMSARIQLVKIMGNENFAKFSRSIMGEMRSRFAGRRPNGELGPMPMGPMQWEPTPDRP